jgi:hypothetical protein
MCDALIEHGGQDRLRHDPMFGDEYVRVDAKTVMRLLTALLRERQLAGPDD